jgi:hypothetical protein
MAGSASASSPPLAPERHVAAVALAITKAWQPHRRRAYVIGLAAGILAGGIVAPLVTTSLLLVLVVTRTRVGEALAPWDLLAWLLTFVVTFATVGALAMHRSLPAHLRAAVEAYMWLADRSETAWRRTMGPVRVPRTEKATRAFLAATPETPENAGERYGLWMSLGEVDRAEAALEQTPEATAGQPYDRASAQWLLAFVRGETASPDLLAPLVDAIEAPEEQAAAQVELATHHARVAVAQGGDWIGPLADVRPLLAEAPNDAIRRHITWPMFRRLLVLGLIGVSVFFVLDQVVLAAVPADALLPSPR